MKKTAANSRYWLIVLALTVLTAAAAWSCARIGEEARQGIQAVEDYGCGSCHTIPGVPRANGMVGPPLYFWASRSYIAGSLVNNPDNLIDWLMNPQVIEPGTAMPQMGVSEAAARDIGAYLYTLHADNHGRVSIRGYTGESLPLPVPGLAD